MSDSKITPFLWFDDDAGEAVELYLSVFAESKLLSRNDYPDGMPGGASGLMTADIELFGQRLTLMNGGPSYKLSPAFSLVIDCDGAEEVDYYWDALLAGGGRPDQCGWLQDRFGVSWQVIPRQLIAYLTSPDAEVAGRVGAAMMTMTKIDVAALDAAAAG